MNRGLIEKASVYIPEEDNAIDGQGVEDLRKEFEEDEDEDIF